MDIQEALLKEHSKTQTARITNYIGDNADRFRLLVQLFLGDNHLITQRAAWVLSNCGRAYPELVGPYQQQLLDKLKTPGQHDAVKRNILRIWVHQMPPETLWGMLFDYCYGFARSKDEPGAIKAFSLYILGNIAVGYPELATEVRILIEDLRPIATPAIASSSKKVLKQLDKR
jgi:hypothetical protein